MKMIFLAFSTPGGTLEALIVSLVGIDETFSATIHDRHVYNAQDVVFGRRLADVMTTRPDGTLAVDYTRFHDLV